MFQMPTLAENSRKFQRIMQILRDSPTTSTNHAKFAPFINSLYIMFQVPAPAENSLKFQQIMQIPHDLPTTSVNHAKFAPFINPLYSMFQISDHRQRTPENWSKSTRFHAVHPQLLQIMQNSLKLHPCPAD